MIKFSKAGFLFIGFFTATNSLAVDLTEGTVTEFISKIEQATVNKDLDTLSNTLSDNVDITINISVQGQTQVVKPTKQEYIETVRQGWAVAENYEYSKSGMEISIANSKALVKSLVTESMTIQGQQIVGKTKEEITIEVIGGQLLVTGIVGYTSL